MPGRLRTVLILAALAVVGVTALALLAQRYRGMIPESSVRDLETAPAPAVPASPEPAPDPAPVPEAPKEGPAVEDEKPSAAPSEADRSGVAGFLEVRAAIRAFVTENRKAARKIAAELARDPASGESVPVDPLFFAGYRLTRDQALRRVGMESAEYERVRAAWAAWRKGEAQGGLAAAFDAAGEKAREAGLLGLEPLDYKLAF